MLSTAYHRTCTALVAKRWLDGREAQKSALYGALDPPAVAKFEFQLPLVFFRLSQFFDPRLYLLYCVKHSPIEDLDIAFSGDMRFQVTQDVLYDFVLGTDFIQVRRKSPSESVPTVPRQAHGLKCSANHSAPSFVYTNGKSVTGMKNNTCFWAAHGPAVLVQDFRQGGNYRRGLTAGTCFWKVGYRHPDRTFDHQFGARVIGPLESTQFTLAQPGRAAVGTRLFSKGFPPVYEMASSRIILPLVSNSMSNWKKGLR
jgi:hypothetical protein